MLSWKYLEGLNYPGCFSFRISFLHPSASQPLLPHISTPVLSTHPSPPSPRIPLIPTFVPQANLPGISIMAFRNSQIGLRSLLALLGRGVRVSGGRAAVHGAAANPPARRKTRKPKAPVEDPQAKRWRKRGRCSFTSKQVVEGARGRRASERTSECVYRCLAVERVRAHARARAGVSETLLSSSSRISLRLNWCRAGAFIAVLEICIHLLLRLQP